MPIQIRELIITASIEEHKIVGESKAPEGEKHSLPLEEREEMVQQCVDEVLKVLKHKIRR